MTLIRLLIAASVILSLWFVVQLWPPWKAHDAPIAWLLSGLAVTAAVWDAMILLATYRIAVPFFVALTFLAAQDALLIWRLVSARRSR